MQYRCSEATLPLLPFSFPMNSTNICMRVGKKDKTKRILKKMRNFENDYVRLLLTKFLQKKSTKKIGGKFFMNNVSSEEINGVVYWLILSNYFDASNHEVYQHHEDWIKAPKCFYQKGSLTIWLKTQSWSVDEVHGDQGCLLRSIPYGHDVRHQGAGSYRNGFMADTWYTAVFCVIKSYRV